MPRGFARTVAALTLAAALVTGIGTASARQARTQIDWTAVGNAIGVQGKLQPDGVYRVGLPRTDLHVELHGVKLKPSFALGSYLVFMSTGGSNALMMGDLVLTEDEIQPVMSKLEQGGIEITALHNHLIGTKPLVMYMHVMGEGDAVQLATAAHDALALSDTPLKAQPAKPTDATVDLDTAALDAIIGAAGKVDTGVYKYSFAPKYTVSEDGMALPPSMGTTTAFAFQPIHKGDAAITGDFALLADQVNPVIRALRANGIAVTALHSHMLNTTPTQFFMHFYAAGDPVALAHGLRAALDAMG
jgi:hypothetical protein